VTAPISDAPATAHDRALSEELVKLLRDNGRYESQEEFDQRLRVIAALNDLVQEWVQECCRAAHLSDAAARQCAARIYTFGSYRLGVNASGGDIDMLLVVPRFVTRDAFFATLRPKLEASARVRELTSVPDAFVPLMKFYFDGVDIDLLFASVALSVLPPTFNIHDDSVLAGIDDKSVRSLNGARVNDGILMLVPNQNTFRTTLRFIKFWAKRRGVYSNVLGYPGGIAWAIMTARVCQLYPFLEASSLVAKFFLTYAHWKWPHAVHLTPPVRASQLGLRVWDEASARGDLMPVITPAYPCMNSTHNVSVSTKRVLLAEFARGVDITRGIDRSLPVTGARALFERLAAPSEFFSTYKHYLDITVSAGSQAEMDIWNGFTEARLRQLLHLLQAKNLPDREPYLKIHPHPKPWEDTTVAAPALAHHYYFGIDFDAAAAPVLPGAPPGSKPTLDIGGEIAKFTGDILADKCRAGDMSISVGFLRAAQLPDGVFPDGVKPAVAAKKAAKKAKTAAAAAAAGARDGGPDVQLPAPIPAPTGAAPAATAAAATMPTSNATDAAAAAAAPAAPATAAAALPPKAAAAPAPALTPTAATEASGEASALVPASTSASAAAAVATAAAAANPAVAASGE
jgi:poly(A) polymerase